MPITGRSASGNRSRFSIQSYALTICCLLLLSGMVDNGGGAVNSPAQTPAAHETLRGAAAQKRNFLMGTAADSVFLSEPIYASTLAAEYSQLEAENEMKFGPIHPEPATYNYAGPDELVAFAMAHYMKVRGHNLVWHEQVPDWVTSPQVPWTPTTLNRVLADHIANVVGHYKGKVYAWDVVNEPFNEDGTMRSTIWYNSPGIGFAGQGTRTIEQALRWAHAADPTAQLFVNEYGGGGPQSEIRCRVCHGKGLRDARCAAVGHRSCNCISAPASISRTCSTRSSRNIRRLAALGLEVQFTEVDVQLHDGGGCESGGGG